MSFSIHKAGVYSDILNRCERTRGSCRYQDGARASFKTRLEEKLHSLEAQIHELSEPFSSQSAALTPAFEPVLSHPLFLQDSKHRSSLQVPIWIPFLPYKIWDNDQSLASLTVQDNEAYSFVVSRDVVEDVLSQWDHSTELPETASRYL